MYAIEQDVLGKWKYNAQNISGIPLQLTYTSIILTQQVTTTGRGRSEGILWKLKQFVGDLPTHRFGTQLHCWKWNENFQSVTPFNVDLKFNLMNIYQKRYDIFANTKKYLLKPSDNTSKIDRPL